MSDIPEITAGQMKTAIRGIPRRQRVELMLDPAFVSWVKNTPEDGDLETQINRILRQHMITEIRKLPA